MALEDVLKKYRSIINKKTDFGVLSLGPVSLNIAAAKNVHGVQMGTIIQIIGGESSGKTTLCVDIAAQYLKQHPEEYVVWVDFERSVHLDYFQSCGLDIDRLIRLTPDTAEDGLNAIRDFIVNGIKLVIVDSVAFAIPESHYQQKFGESLRVAASAALMTDFCKRIIPILDNYGSTLILINQMRKNISSMSREDEIPFGGKALQHASSITIQLSRLQRIEGVGQVVQAFIRKNKQSAPLERTEFFILFGKGIDHASNIINTAKDMGIVTLNGSWYKYKDLKAQGVENASKMFPLNDIVEDIASMLAR